MRAIVPALSTALVMLGTSGFAYADSMDPALARLVRGGDCRTTGPGGTGAYFNPAGTSRCIPDDPAFAKLVAQYGAAIAPPAMHTPGTSGFGGFEVSLQTLFTKLDSDADFLKRGTQGPRDQNTQRYSTEHENPDGFLGVYAVNLRKGLPFGFEVGTTLGFIGNTSYALGGADLRLSIFEGFRDDIPGVFPEVAVGGGVRTVTGNPEMKLTVGSFDVGIGKPFPIAGTVVLTPYAGYQWLRIFGDSGQIDLTPNTDAIDLCGYEGPNTPVTPDPNKDTFDGQPVCTGGTPADFNNNTVFEEVRLTRHRLDFGMQLRVQMFKVGAHFITDVASPEDANSGEEQIDEITGENVFAGLGQQWTLGFELGTIF